MVREILLSEINELPIRIEYKAYQKREGLERGQNPMSFKKFKKMWTGRKQKIEK